MNRAERRRQARHSGYRRSPNKRGRRPSLRPPDPEDPTEAFPTLARSGFVLAEAKLHLPESDG